MSLITSVIFSVKFLRILFFIPHIIWLQTIFFIPVGLWNTPLSPALTTHSQSSCHQEASSFYTCNALLFFSQAVKRYYSSFKIQHKCQLLPKAFSQSLLPVKITRSFLVLLILLWTLTYLRPILSWVEQCFPLHGWTPYKKDLVLCNWIISTQ